MTRYYRTRAIVLSIIVILLVLLAYARQASAQESVTWSGGLYGGWIREITVHADPRLAGQCADVVIEDGTGPDRGLFLWVKRDENCPMIVATLVQAKAHGMGVLIGYGKGGKIETVSLGVDF